MKGKSVLLLGATGLVGSECLKLLADDEFYSDILLLTRRKVVEYESSPKIKQLIFEFEQTDKYREQIKAEHVVCALGTTIKKARTKENFYKIDFTYTYNIADISLKNGAEHLLLISSLGANSKSRIFYNRVKGQLEEAVSKLNYRSISIFRPSLLAGSRKEFRLGEVTGNIFMRLFSFAIPEKYKPTEAYHLAKVITHVSHKNEPGIRIYEADEIRKIFYKL